MGLSVDKIPVILGGDYSKPPIGWGELSELGILSIEVNAARIVGEITSLARTDDILCLNLGVEYRAARPASEVPKAVDPMDELREGLKRTLQDLDYAITQVKQEHPEDPYRIKYRDGRYILLEALASKANVLVALRELNE